MDAGSIIVKIKSDLSNFHQGIDEAGKKTSKFTGFMDSATKGSAIFAGGLAVVGTALGAAGAFAVKSADDFQQNRIAFETMLGSADKAKNLLKEVSEFAAKTPFELPQVVEGAKSLLAYGVNAEKIIPTFSALGNIAAGVGKDKLPQLTLAFGQVKTATKLTGAELRQFTEAGVPLLEVLAKQSGKTAGQVKEDMEKGIAPSFDEVEKALFSMSQEGGKFFGLMEKQSKSFGGVVSNIMDGAGRIARSIIGINEVGDIKEGSIFDKLTKAATGFMEWLTANQDKIVGFFENTFGWVEKNWPLVAGAIFGGLIPAFAALGVSIWTALAPLLPFIAIGALIGLVIKLIVDHFGGWEAVMERLKPVFQWLKDTWTIIVDYWNTTLLPALKNIWTEFEQKWLPVIQQIAIFLWNQLVPAIKYLWEVISTQLFPVLQKFWQEHGEQIKQLLLVLAVIIGVVLAVAIGIFVAGVVIAIATVAAVIAVFSWLMNTIMSVNNWFRNLQITIMNAMIGAFNWVNQQIINIVNAFNNIVSGIGRALGGVWNAITAPFRDAFNWVKGQVDGVVDKLKSLNPFQRHSPSLFDLISKGNNAIKASYSDMFGSINQMATKNPASAIVGGANAVGNSNVDTRIFGNITIGSEVDADNFLTRLTKNQELANKGLTTNG